jgi:WD40 repeat protein
VCCTGSRLNSETIGNNQVLLTLRRDRVFEAGKHGAYRHHCYSAAQSRFLRREQTVPQSFASTPTWQRALSTTEQVNSCAISADGSRVVAGTSQEFGQGQFAVVCFDRDGNLLWREPVGTAESYQGVFWVAISADGSTVAAGGELADGADGFLVAFDGGTGASLHSQTGLPGRVNEVSLSDDGLTMVAAYMTTLAFFKRDAGQAFGQFGTLVATPHHTFESAMVSGNGTRAVAGSIHYEQGSTVGAIISVPITASGLGPASLAAFDSGVMRVAISADGSAWGGVLHDASCVCFLAGSPGAPVWRHRSDVATEVAYAFGIAGSASGMVYLAYGVNLLGGDGPGSPQGAVFSLTCDALALTPVPVQRWVMPTTFAVNPGVSLDRAGTLVSATDGKPTPGHETVESAGNFYLFDNVANRVLWSYPTSKMNWPMAIAANGRAIVGASDDGSVYYWAGT